MKKTILILAMLFTSGLCFAQKNLISYEDIKYLLHNNLAQADTFLIAKGFTVKSKNEKRKFNEYTLPIRGGTFVNVSLRADGRRMFIDMQTTEIGQYDLINNSISQYPSKTGMAGPDVQTFTIKDVCTVYVTVSDVMPYNPLIKNYDIQIVADKNIVADRDLN